MRVLLDTHILLWWLSEPERLSKAQYDLISYKETQALVSAGSIWEMRIKESLGKIEIPSDIISIIKEEAFQFLAVSEEHADYISRLPIHHKDQFDRIIIAQAKIEDLTLVSSDKIFLKYDIEIIS